MTEKEQELGIQAGKWFNKYWEHCVVLRECEKLIECGTPPPDEEVGRAFRLKVQSDMLHKKAAKAYSDELQKPPEDPMACRLFNVLRSLAP